MPADVVTRAVDWAVSIVSPRRAVIRQHFRRMEQDPEYRETVFAMLRARGYRAAREGKNQTPWKGGFTSADAELGSDGATLRARTRELNRDDPIGSGIIGTLVRDIVGTELRAQAKTTNSKAAASIERFWTRRKNGLAPADATHLGQWQRMLGGGLLVDGEILVKRTVSRRGEPVWFETIEGDRLATPSDAKPQDPQGDIRDGVEKDRWGRPVAYWVSRSHPGDSVSVFQPRSSEFTRVLAESIRHLRLVDRPGQTRGVTSCHAVLQDIRDLDLLMLAALKRMQVSACLALFITSEQRVTDLLEVTAENYGYQLDQDIVPGMIMKLWPGESVSTLIPNFPAPELETFVVMLARRIGAALGISWQTLLRDFSGSNYSSARTTILADRVTVTIWRHLLSEDLLNWIWQSTLEDAWLRGDEDLAGVGPEDIAAGVTWVADGRDWVDPLKEAQAREIELRIGATTLRDICAEKGRDWEEQQDQRLLEEKREIDRRKELGLPPRAEALAPAAPVQDEDEPEEKGDARGFFARASLPRRAAA